MAANSRRLIGNSERKLRPYPQDASEERSTGGCFSSREASKTICLTLAVLTIVLRPTRANRGTLPSHDPGIVGEEVAHLPDSPISEQHSSRVSTLQISQCSRSLSDSASDMHYLGWRLLSLPMNHHAYETYVRHKLRKSLIQSLSSRRKVLLMQTSIFPVYLSAR